MDVFKQQIGISMELGKDYTVSEIHTLISATGVSWVKVEIHNKKIIDMAHNAGLSYKGITTDMFKGDSDEILEHLESIRGDMTFSNLTRLRPNTNLTYREDQKTAFLNYNPLLGLGRSAVLFGQDVYRGEGLEQIVESNVFPLVQSLAMGKAIGGNKGTLRKYIGHEASTIMSSLTAVAMDEKHDIQNGNLYVELFMPMDVPEKLSTTGFNDLEYVNAGIVSYCRDLILQSTVNGLSANFDEYKSIKEISELPAVWGTSNNTLVRGYSARSGDTVSAFQAAANMSDEEFAVLNPHITDKNKLTIGDKLYHRNGESFTIVHPSAIDPIAESQGLTPGAAWDFLLQDMLTPGWSPDDYEYSFIPTEYLESAQHDSQLTGGMSTGTVGKYSGNLSFTPYGQTSLGLDSDFNNTYGFDSSSYLGASSMFGADAGANMVSQYVFEAINGSNSGSSSNYSPYDGGKFADYGGYSTSNGYSMGYTSSSYYNDPLLDQFYTSWDAISDESIAYTTSAINDDSSAWKTFNFSGSSAAQTYSNIEAPQQRQYGNPYQGHSSGNWASFGGNNWSLGFGNSGGGFGFHFSFSFPVAIDMDGDGDISLVSLDESTAFFDMDGDEYKENTGWVASNDGILVYDMDNDGEIKYAKELSFKLWSDEAETDFDGLRMMFDTDGNKKLDSGDENFDKFYIWQDLNQNGETDAGELTRLLNPKTGKHDANITSINLDYGEMDGEVETHEDADGNLNLAAVQATDDDKNHVIDRNGNVLLRSTSIDWEGDAPGEEGDSYGGDAFDVTLKYSVAGYQKSELDGKIRLNAEDENAEFNIKEISETTDQTIDLAQAGYDVVYGNEGNDTFSTSGLVIRGTPYLIIDNSFIFRVNT